MTAKLQIKHHKNFAAALKSATDEQSMALKNSQVEFAVAIINRNPIFHHQQQQRCESEIAGQ
jgi:hypothetical protein